MKPLWYPNPTTLMIVFGAFLTAALVAGCGSSTKTVTETVSSETTTTVEGSTVADESAPAPSDNGHAESGGIEVTVARAFAKPSLEYVGGNYSPTSPNAERQTVRAPQGGRYVYVDADVLNETSEGLDLTCGYPMKVKLRDADGRGFDPVENLYEVVGNPECNEQLQPGFRHKMTWVFLVPPTAEVKALEFSDVTDFAKEQPPAAIAIPSV